MNIDNINKLIDHLSQLPPERFSMSSFTSRINETPAFIGSVPPVQLNTDCGTCGCIAGWTVALFDPDKNPFHYMEFEALGKSLLGLTIAQGDSLFYPINTGKTFDKVTIPEAIKTLTILRDTGEVDWSHAAIPA